MSPVRPVRRRLISTRVTRTKSNNHTNKETDVSTSVLLIMMLAAAVAAANVHIHIAGIEKREEGIREVRSWWLSIAVCTVLNIADISLLQKFFLLGIEWKVCAKTLCLLKCLIEAATATSLEHSMRAFPCFREYTTWQILVNPWYLVFFRYWRKHTSQHSFP